MHYPRIVARLMCLFALFTFGAQPLRCQNFEPPGNRRPPDDPGRNLGHTRLIRDIDFSPNGNLIATASEDYTVRLWDARSGTLRRTLLGHTDDVFNARFSPDGTMLLSGSRDKTARIWFINANRPAIVLRGHKDILWSVCWSQDGRTLATGGGDGYVMLWDTKGSNKLRFHTPYCAIDVLAFSKDGRTILINGRNVQTTRSPSYYDSITGKQKKMPMTNAVGGDDQFSPDGRLIALPGYNHSVRIRDAETGNLRFVIKSLTTESPKIAFSRNSRYLVAMSFRQAHSDEIVQLYDAAAGKPVGLKYEAGYIHDCGLSPDGKHLAVVDFERENRFQLREATSTKTLWTSADPALILGSKPSKSLLHQLCADYRNYGLPYPPSRSILAYVQPRRKNRAPYEPQHTLALVEMPSEKTNRPKYYVSFGQRDVYDEEEIIPIPPAQASPSGTKPGWNSSYLGPLIWGYNADMLAAIQMQQRGWTDLAMKFLTRALNDYRMDARKDLAKQAWSYWWSTIAKQDSDRLLIARRLRVLMKTPYVSASGENTHFVQDLESSVIPSTAASASIEADIDGLVNMFDSRRLGEKENYPSYHRLWLRGFEAVPALLEHLDDRRYTRLLIQSMGNASPYYARVREVVADLLKGLAGNDDAVGVEWYTDGPGYRCNPAKAELWWTKSREIGEETYLVGHVLPKENKESTWPNEHNAAIIAKKYPSRLPAIYKTMMEKYPKAVSWRIAELMKESQVPDAERIPLLVRAASTGDAQQRLGAFWQLSNMKYPGTVDILVERLNGLPSTPDGPYWTCEAGGLAMIAQDLDDPKGWNALLRLANRSDVGQRLEILHHLGHQRSDGARLRHRIEFIAKFAEDKTLRVASERDPAVLAKLDPRDWNKAKYDGPYADFDLKSITVQDSALREISHEIGLKEYPLSDWSKADWDAWRVKARQKLSEYLSRSNSTSK